MPFLNIYMPECKLDLDANQNIHKLFDQYIYLQMATQRPLSQWYTPTVSEGLDKAAKEIHDTIAPNVTLKQEKHQINAQTDLKNNF